MEDLKNGEALGKNIHKEYWSHVFYGVRNFILKHGKSSLIVGFVIVLVALTYLGYIKYSPEFSFLMGKFKVEEANTNTRGNAADSNSKKLDRSIFDLAKETLTTDLTSQQRVNLISNISGLETKEEAGKIEDIGTDGLTLIIAGNSVDGFGGMVLCDFLSSWKQRISLLKKDSEIKFIGTVSKYNLSRQWIDLKDCRLSD